MDARFLVLAVLAALIGPSIAMHSGAWARQASPHAVACHDHATKKYIADFRQVGPRRVSFGDRGPTIVAVYENENPRYEDYFAACMKRATTDDAR